MGMRGPGHQTSLTSLQQLYQHLSWDVHLRNQLSKDLSDRIPEREGKVNKSFHTVIVSIINHIVTGIDWNGTMLPSGYL